jgi:beta-phosphoglucomutase
MLKGIIFDLDGVIVDSHPAHKKAWRALLRSLGRNVSEQQLEFVVEGHKREQILRHFLGELGEEEVRQYGALKDKYFADVAHEVSAVSGVLDFVDEAEAAGLALGVGTSAGRRRAEEMLERLGLRSRLHAIVTGDEVRAGKPDPAIFQVAAEQLGIASRNVLVCEDAVAGVQAAKRAGMKCLAIAADGRRMLLETAGADWVVQDFTHTTLEQITALFAAKSTGRSACAAQF